jgi:hypothetical protein
MIVGEVVEQLLVIGEPTEAGEHHRLPRQIRMLAELRATRTLKAARTLR